MPESSPVRGPLLDWQARLPPSVRPGITYCTVLRGGSVFRRGTAVTHLYFVLSGEVTGSDRGVNGPVVILCRSHAHDFVNPQELMSETHGFDAVARRRTELACIPVARLRDGLLAGGPSAAETWQLLAAQWRRQSSRLERHRLKHAKVRVLHDLQVEGPAGIGRSYRLRQWAVELGLEPATLSRALAALVRQGQVVRDGASVRLASDEPARHPGEEEAAATG